MDDGTERRAISLIINSNILQKVIASDLGSRQPQPCGPRLSSKNRRGGGAISTSDINR